MSPGLLFCIDGKAKLFVVVNFMLMHVGMALAMQLWNFSPVCIVALIPFLPVYTWIAVERLFPSSRYSVHCRSDKSCIMLRIFMQLPLLGTVSLHEASYADMKEKFKEAAVSAWVLQDEEGRHFSGFTAALKLFGKVPPLSMFSTVSETISCAEGESDGSQNHSHIHGQSLFRRFSRVCVPGFLLCLTLLITYETLPGCKTQFSGCYDDVESTDQLQWGPFWYRSVANKLGMEGRWHMFSVPHKSCGWWTLPARLNSNRSRTIDMFKVKHDPRASSDLSFERPEWPAFQIKTQLWYTFYEKLFEAFYTKLYAKSGDEELEFLSESLLRFYCQTYKKDLKVVQITFSGEKYTYNPPDTPIKYTNSTLYAKKCEGWDSQMGYIPKILAHDNLTRIGPATSP